MKLISRLLDYLFSHRVLRHIIYWACFLLLSLLYGWGINEPFLVSWYLELIYLPVQILASYTFIYIQLPLLYRRKYALFSTLTLVFIYVFAMLAHINYDFGVGTRLSGWHLPHEMAELLTDPEFFFRFFVDVYVVVLLTAGAKLVIQHFESQREIQALEAAKLKNEYTLIHSRLQPKFLLRTIKLIEEQSVANMDATPTIISDLSDILDYRLYGSRASAISVTDACDHLNTYLRTHALGRVDLVDTRVVCEDEYGKRISPLTFSKLLESLLTQLSMSDDPIQKLHANVVSESTLINLRFDIAPVKTDRINLQEMEQILSLDYKDKFEVMKEDQAIIFKIEA